MITTTGGYTIKETDTGVELVHGTRVVTSYRIIKCKNGKWRVRLNGASFGLEIGYFVSESKTFGEVFNQCVIDLNWVIDQLLSKKAGN